jgi:hypothetical protein
MGNYLNLLPGTGKTNIQMIMGERSYSPTKFIATLLPLKNHPKVVLLFALLLTQY